MEYEGSAHSESSTEKAGFEDIVSRRSLTGSRGGGCAGAGGRPVVPSEHERGEVDFNAQARRGERVWWSLDGRMLSRDLRARRLRDGVSAPAAASSAFLTSQGRYEACPSVPPDKGVSIERGRRGRDLDLPVGGAGVPGPGLHRGTRSGAGLLH
jgi:hypothetical protein